MQNTMVRGGGEMISWGKEIKNQELGEKNLKKGKEKKE